MPFGADWICGCGRRVAHAQGCACQIKRSDAHKAARDARRSSSRDRGYDSKWDKARATFLSHNSLCVMQIEGARCGKPATVVDHVEPHRGDQAKFWDSANWQPLCAHCHSSRKQAIERSGDGPRRLSADAQRRTLPFDVRRSCIPVTVVCGPAGSGKSTYVLDRAAADDVIIDLDVIRSRLARVSIHDPAPTFTAAALEERNRMLRSLATDREHARAWFIVGAPEAAERKAWRNKLGAVQVVLLAVPLEECRRRIYADPERAGQRQRMEDFARDWWRRFTPDEASLNAQGPIIGSSAEPATGSSAEPVASSSAEPVIGLGPP